VQAAGLIRVEAVQCEKRSNALGLCDGPPEPRIDITALPTSIRSVRANICPATWKKSVQSPTSPGK
jgi:hypothetical protein